MVDIQKKLVLFDIDGVIADDSYRVQYALDKQWDRYFQLAETDTPLQEGVNLANSYKERPDVEIQYLTGRRIDLYETTKLWLKFQAQVPNPEKITMRGFAHRDVLAKFKVGVIRNAIEGGYFSSVLLYEDDPEVVRLVNETFGEGTAILTTWYVKHSEMIKSAKS